MTTDSQTVERVAREMFERLTGLSWESASKTTRNEFRDSAIHAIRAHAAQHVLNEIAVGL